MGEVGCLVGWEALLLGRAESIVGFLGDSVLTVDMYGVANNIRSTSCFGCQETLVGYFSVSAVRVSY